MSDWRASEPCQILYLILYLLEVLGLESRLTPTKFVLAAVVAQRHRRTAAARCWTATARAAAAMAATAARGPPQAWSPQPTRPAGGRSQWVHATNMGTHVAK
jgi:hypothetical protein